MHQTIEAALRERRDVRLLTVVDLIQLVGTERNHPHFSVRDLDAVGSFEVLSLSNLLRFIAGDLPDGIRSGGLEVSARAGFQTAVGNVNALAVARGIVQKCGSGNRDLTFRCA